MRGITKEVIVIYVRNVPQQIFSVFLITLPLLLYSSLIIVEIVNHHNNP